MLFSRYYDCGTIYRSFKKTMEICIKQIVNTETSFSIILLIVVFFVIYDCIRKWHWISCYPFNPDRGVFDYYLRIGMKRNNQNKAYKNLFGYFNVNFKNCICIIVFCIILCVLYYISYSILKK